MKLMRRVILIVVILAVSASGWIGYRLYSSNMMIWLPNYVLEDNSVEPVEGVTDIIFFVPDHWEPGGNLEPLNLSLKGYRSLCDQHKDADGIGFQASFFYPINSFRGFEVDSLVKMCAQGGGDIEVHLHHHGDTPETFRLKMLAGIDSLRAHGALISPDGDTHFSFVHGNWALDNSRVYQGRDMCGVNNEIEILQELGCYADFTFPALTHTAQPTIVNEIYYCVDDPDKPKSHDSGVPTRVGYHPRANEFMIFEGPLVVDWADWQSVTHPTFEDGNLYYEMETNLHRFEVWLNANIHVEGRSNWVFVRPFTHGCHLRAEGSYENIYGENMHRMLTEVERLYNDGQKYRLHYVTAREAYNIVKAAEDGKNGNPNDFRDYVLKPYQYQMPAI